MHRSKPRGALSAIAPRYGLPTILISIVLTLYVGFLLVANYWSATNLRQTMETQRRMESGRRVAALQYFFSERRDDLANLALSREVAAFYENRALGMSPRYGLKQSLVPIGTRFIQLIDRKRIGSRPIYLRLLLLDENGEVLVDEPSTAAVPEPARPWKDFLNPAYQDGHILVLDGGHALAVSLASEFKGSYAGQFIAFLNPDLVGQEVLSVDRGADDTYVATLQGGHLHAIGGALPPDLTRLALPKGVTDGQLLDFRTGANGDGEQMIALARLVPGTDFILLDLMSATQLRGRLEPWHLILGMGSLAVVVLLGVFLILRLNLRAVALQTHLRESAVREKAVQEKNLELEQEISERRRVESELRLSKEAAEAANRAKSEFLANMSHEIRNPMIGVVGMANLLAESRLDEEQREYVNVVLNSADALLAVIDGILDYSKAEAGKLSLNENDFSLRGLLEELADMFAYKADERGLGFASICERSVPDWLRADPGRLRQILINLVGNAVKFTEAGEVEVRAAVRPGPDGVPRLQIVVRDTGIGIAPDRLGLLFRSFYQVDTSFTRRYGGTGLGLAISRRLAELMGGEIGVDSREGQGSRFWLELPLVPGEGPVPAVPRRTLPPAVLLMDPLEIGRIELTEALAHVGVAVFAAADTGAAMDELLAAEDRDAPYQVALIVLRRPGEEGDRFLELAPHQPWRVPLSVLVMVPQGRRREFAVAARNAVQVLTTPVHRAALLDALGSPRPAASPEGEAAGPPDPADCVGDAPAGSPAETSGELGTEPPAETRSRPPDAPPAAAATGDATLARAAILLVEDNKLSQKVVTPMLERLGYRVDAVDNGLLALGAVDRGQYQLVLMDIQMPEMDGLEATRRIREAEASGRLHFPSLLGHLPIVAMTAHALESDRRLCLESGMDEVITKPVKRQVLVDTLDRVLAGHSARAD